LIYQHSIVSSSWAILRCYRKPAEFSVVWAYNPDYRHSDRKPADEKYLLNSWHQAQKILEGAPTVQSKTETPKKPEDQAPAKPAEDHTSTPAVPKPQPKPANK